MEDNSSSSENCNTSNFSTVVSLLQQVESACVAELDREQKGWGLAMKRNKAPAWKAKPNIEGKLRKKSAFAVFKTEFLGREGRWSLLFVSILL